MVGKDLITYVLIFRLGSPGLVVYPNYPTSDSRTVTPSGPTLTYHPCFSLGLRKSHRPDGLVRDGIILWKTFKGQPVGNRFGKV